MTRKKYIFLTALASGLLASHLLGPAQSALGNTVSEQQRQGLVAKYHLTTADSWSNDLQTIVWNEAGRYYDIYFLHSADGADEPFGDQGQDWYHTTTTDFIHFTEQNSAVSSHGGDDKEGWKSAWTGGVIENKGQIKGAAVGEKVAYISGLRKDNGKQAIWALASKDGGRTFSQVLNNGKPLLDGDWSWASPNHIDERDPYVFSWNNKLYMYVAEGDVLGVYQSENGIDWSKADPAGKSKVEASTFFKGRSWQGNDPVECPVLKTMTLPNGQTKQVLFFGAKDARSGETTGTYYTVGHMDGNGLFVAERDVKRLDQGSDYYGANFTGSMDLGQSNSELISMGWVGNWNYSANGVHADSEASGSYIERLGSYSLARRLTLDADWTIRQNFIYEAGLGASETFTNISKDRPKSVEGKTWVDRKDTNGNVYGLYDLPNQAVNKIYKLRFSSKEGNYIGRIYFDIWQGKDYVFFNYDPSNGMYNVKQYAGELDRGINGEFGSSYYYDGLLGHGNGYLAQSGLQDQKEIELLVFTDKTSIEFVFPNGQSYTVARYSNSDQQDFKVFTEDPHNRNQLDMTVTEMKP
ncbi:glycoside hydrolase family 32 protein [Streptococcus oricebi]|uniref:Exo-beta-D-fructosidase n=1 Tax=Streptococcus oricebi TaxID=1547447 RepID=A0ABS5B4H2_9STRE|nr:glycoside hydrolase family 32 protein [Streptococcus oricebi]MBP2623710.1 exo-beta-D-fructosidase [Streptococcus oricebi]